MLRTDALAEWFVANGSTVPVSKDVLPDSSPVRVAAVRITGGLGLEAEDVLDRPTYILYIRGSNGGDAEEIGVQLDNIWMNAPSEFAVGDFTVKGKGRFGGPPAYVSRDSETGKVLRAATYWCRIVR